MSSLHDPRLRAEPLLDIALGLRSTIARFDALLDQFAPPRTDSAGVPEPTVDDEPHESREPMVDGEPDDIRGDAWTLIVLGAIALRSRLARELARAAVPTIEQRVERNMPDEGLLR